MIEIETLFNNEVAINELNMMKENLIAGIVGVVFFCAIVIPLLILTGCFEGEEPTPTPIVTPTLTPTPKTTTIPEYNSALVRNYEIVKIEDIREF